MEAAAPRVLVIRPAHLGDMLLTLPAIVALRRVLPRARITVVAPPLAAEAARLCPAIDEVAAMPFPPLDKPVDRTGWPNRARRLGGELAALYRRAGRSGRRQRSAAPGGDGGHARGSALRAGRPGAAPPLLPRATAAGGAHRLPCRPYGNLLDPSRGATRLPACVVGITERAMVAAIAGLLGV